MKKLLVLAPGAVILLVIWFACSRVPVGTGPTQAGGAAYRASASIPDAGTSLARIHGAAVDSGVLAGAEVFQDPFYGFIISITEGDSLGVWTSRQLEAYMESCGKESHLPWRHFQTIERRAARGEELESRRGARVQRIWRLTLDETLHFPLPYSILGYEPGSLSLARVMVFSEWRLGQRNLHAPGEGKISVVPVAGLTVFRLDSGWIVLDVDAWLDKILGRKLDDCWTQGFAICRQGGQMRALALSCNRKLKPICGELDLYTNKVTALGSPLGRGIHVYVRPWIEPPSYDVSQVWQYEQ